MTLLRLVQGQVRVGAPLPWGVRDDTGQLLLARGQVVRSSQQLAALLSRGAYVDDAEFRAARRLRSARAEGNMIDQWNRLLLALDKTLRGAAGDPAFVQRVEELASVLSHLTHRDEDLAIFLAVRHDSNRYSLYGALHAVHCAVTCHLIARRMSWSAETSSLLVKAALTMNVAMVDLQGRLALQATPLTESQRAAVRAHPELGIKMLRAAGVTDVTWLTAVAQHHEKQGGGGYPYGLEDVHLLAQALHYADVFCAKFSARSGRAALAPDRAARDLFMRGRGGTIASAIIKEFGLYPPGSYVKLRSGEAGVVVRRGASAKSPVVACLVNRAGEPLLEPLPRDTALAEFEIIAAVSDKNVLVRVPTELLFAQSRG